MRILQIIWKYFKLSYEIILFNFDEISDKNLFSIFWLLFFFFFIILEFYTEYLIIIMPFLVNW